ncbi:beta-1,4 N-acetylgalactosaminyltransferase 1-like isoform X1 [Myxocyprinus asiaticus]|uniref:beta-1,4 N-acetylgalactosaminyltransferase 1-like isoform X1 n=1 Tax=Myxocyprinus asiaticus TaxID=70543 RepID=UPI002222C79B|nr:beta-1,4 N-acetylgalactosaminyltransferase 1-like isoform X1 [Myxocyprinus asiaticus]XP_051518189.1 beta-1,4 N-acetylgalactosaminyltransferase 1-like isoform X1 [Myxocyprinus asiaticus]
MRVIQKKTLGIFLVVLPLMVILKFHWTSSTIATTDVLQRQDSLKELLEIRIQQMEHGNDNIPYHIKDSVSRSLAINGCVCEGDKLGIHFPFAHLLFPQVSATQLRSTVQDSDLERAQKYNKKEYHSFRKRTYTAADLLILAEANSPLQYPTQGVEVRPKRTILIPGLSLKDNSKKSSYLVNLNATMGTFDTAALVDGVQIKGDGEMQISFVSRSLAALNRQLQFVTYTNTQFHPNTADVVQLNTVGFQASFTIRIRHPPMPKFYNPGPQKEYNVNTLVTIATKTFLRYDKVQDLINSIRQFYPTITIVIADDTKDPKPVTGPYIEHYIMPFGKGWFAGRNLAVSQVTTKYVLWVDDDFIFTSNTKLEKMVDILERTTLDLVGGAVREVTGYSATYRHTISTDAGDEEGDCLHIRTGYHHVIEGFPNCVVADGVINFFMARTEKIRQVGFDPRLARVGHLAFFIDGLDSLYVGSCDDVIIDHASKIKAMLPWGQSEIDKAYSKFRYPSTQETIVNEYDLFYRKNHFKCVTSD